MPHALLALAAGVQQDWAARFLMRERSQSSAAPSRAIRRLEATPVHTIPTLPGRQRGAVVWVEIALRLSAATAVLPMGAPGAVSMAISAALADSVAAAVVGGPAVAPVDLAAAVAVAIATVAADQAVSVAAA